MAEGSIDEVDTVAAVSTPTGVTLAAESTPGLPKGRFSEAGDDIAPCGRVQRRRG